MAVAVGAPILQAQGLGRQYQRQQGGQKTASWAVRDVTLQVRRGEFLAIMGSSGSGKSTLLHLLGGLDAPSDGQLFLDGVELSGLTEEKATHLRRKMTGFVFQFFNLLPTLTAYENITLPLLIAGQPIEPAAPWIKEIVARVGLSEESLDHYPNELSGGEQQRVAIARALLPRPALVLADEPTGNLDHRTGQEVLSLLRGSCLELGQTIIMVTHEAKAAVYADRVVVMQDGALVEQVEIPADAPRNTAAPLIARLQERGL
jgi:putative ABC transport system ATP-binding protein